MTEDQRQKLDEIFDRIDKKMDAWKRKQDRIRANEWRRRPRKIPLK